MMKIVNISSIVLLCLITAGSLSSQEDQREIDHDTRLWTSVILQKEVVKNLGVQLEHALRWNDNVKELYRNFTQVGIKYKFTKWASAKTGMRYAYGDEGYQRYYIGVGLQTKYEMVKFKVASRFEHTQDRGEDQESSSRFRQKGEISFAKKKWRLKPFVFSELFFAIEDKTLKPYNRIRYGLGSQVKINNANSVEINVFNQDASKKKKLKRDLTISLDYKYEF